MEKYFVANSILPALVGVDQVEQVVQSLLLIFIFGIASWAVFQVSALYIKYKEHVDEQRRP